MKLPDSAEEVPDRPPPFGAEIAEEPGSQMPPRYHALLDSGPRSCACWSRDAALRGSGFGILPGCLDQIAATACGQEALRPRRLVSAEAACGPTAEQNFPVTRTRWPSHPRRTRTIVRYSLLCGVPSRRSR